MWPRASSLVRVQKIAGLLAPVLDLQSLDSPEDRIVGHQDKLGGERVSSDHQVQVAHGLPSSFEFRSNLRVLLGGV